MEGAQYWSSTSVAVVSAAGWSRASIVAGQLELERLRREVDAAFAALVIADGGDDRDSAARIARSMNVSTRCARERVRVARVCDAVPAAFSALASGDVSAEHVSVLTSVIDDPEAAALIELGAVQSPEKFRRTVMRHRLQKDPADVRKRQHDARSLSFFDGERGQVGLLHGEASTKAGSASKSGKPALVITIDAKTLEAELVGHGPIPLEDALEVAARAELYAAIRHMSGEILNFGRSKRFASAIQNLALVVRDKQCMHPGCDGHWTMTDAHHTHEFENGGLTDLEWLARLCKPHHTYLHAKGLRLVKRDGVWVVERAGPGESDTG
jgi:hypothetical protein